MLEEKSGRAVALQERLDVNGRRARAGGGGFRLEGGKVFAARGNRWPWDVQASRARLGCAAAAVVVGARS